MVNFNKRILITGFGVVAQAALPMLQKRLRVPLSTIAIIDFADVQEAVQP